jgi:hypothetical protein
MSKLVALGLILLLSPNSLRCTPSHVHSVNINATSYNDWIPRIFAAEHDMIALLKASQLLTEGYVQSMGHLQYDVLDKRLDESSEYVIDDKYFLASVDLHNLNNTNQMEKTLFAPSAISKYILANDGTKEKVPSAGQLSMFFVDMTSFDSDTYTLTYESTQSLGDTDCIVFSVRPNASRYTGRFVGHIWIEVSSARIVRINGMLTNAPTHSLRHRTRHYRFDSWRERVGALWLPTLAYFDDRRTSSHDGTLLHHYRGYTALWQHQRHSGRSGVVQSDAVTRLEDDGLLAPRGTVEESLNAIVRSIGLTSKLSLSDIECRVLVTTPVELFSIGHTIIVSKGLLNIVPDDSVLAVLIARQMAHIALRQSQGPSRDFRASVFALKDRHDVRGLGMQWSQGQEAAADRTASVLLRGSVYKFALPRATSFLVQLKRQSNRFPNLLLARFGPSVTPAGSIVRDLRRSGQGVESVSLQLRNKYNVSWNGVVIFSGDNSDPAEFNVEGTHGTGHLSMNAP